MLLLHQYALHCFELHCIARKLISSVPGASLQDLAKLQLSLTFLPGRYDEHGLSSRLEVSHWPVTRWSSVCYVRSQSGEACHLDSPLKV